MEKNVKAWFVLAIFVMAFLTGHVTNGIRDVPKAMKEEVYKPELLGALLGPAWGLAAVPAIIAAIWPIAFLGLCCGGHNGDSTGAHKPPHEGAPKGKDGYGAFMANSGTTVQAP